MKDKEMETEEVVEQARWERERGNQQRRNSGRIADGDLPTNSSFLKRSLEEARGPYKGPELSPNPSPHGGYKSTGFTYSG